MTSLEERLRAWARPRIETCRIQERKFADAWPTTRGHGPPQALVEAWTERRTLQQILDILDEASQSSDIKDAAR